jgi:hypothetical protein
MEVYTELGVRRWRDFYLQVSLRPAEQVTLLGGDRNTAGSLPYGAA